MIYFAHSLHCNLLVLLIYSTCVVNDLYQHIQFILAQKWLVTLTTHERAVEIGWVQNMYML